MVTDDGPLAIAEPRDRAGTFEPQLIPKHARRFTGFDDNFIANILKRLLVHASACNLGLWMRTMCGVGTPRSLQGGLAALTALVLTFWAISGLV